MRVGGTEEKPVVVLDRRERKIGSGDEAGKRARANMHSKTTHSITRTHSIKRTRSARTVVHELEQTHALHLRSLTVERVLLL